MKKINLSQDWEIDRAKDTKAPSDEDITLNWITTVMGYGYKNGLTADQRRLFGSIYDKTDAARISKTKELELNIIQYEFLKSCFEKATVSPQESIMVNKVEQIVLSATMEGTTAASVA